MYTGLGLTSGISGEIKREDKRKNSSENTAVASRLWLNVLNMSPTSSAYELTDAVTDCFYYSSAYIVRILLLLKESKNIKAEIFLAGYNLYHAKQRKAKEEGCKKKGKT